MSRPAISAVVTTLNNAATLDACLKSLRAFDEIVVLDSGSSDDTALIAQRHGARWQVRAFTDYATQKQAAIELASHDWIVLLDADEFLHADSARLIRDELASPRAHGYRLPRSEWLFWRWPHRLTRPNWQLRLFNRQHGAMNDVPVHAAPEVRGRVIDLDAPFLHFGESDIATRVDKINRYSSGLLARSKAPRGMTLRLLLYPTFSFWRMYLGKRYFLNGWAGFIAARTHGYYAFLKYAKRLEAARAAADARERPHDPD